MTPMPLQDPLNIAVAPLRKRRVYRGLISVLVLILLPLPCDVARAENGTDASVPNPCLSASPPAWCEDARPSTVAYPAGTGQPDADRSETSLPNQEPPLFLVGSTLVAPPPVLWLNDRPTDPSRVFGVGEAATFVKALELILPSGWTIWTSEDIRRLNRVIGERVLWDGSGRPWTDVLESMAQQYGVEITADYLSRRAVVGLSPNARAEGPGPAARSTREPASASERSPLPQSGFGEAKETQIERSHPAYRMFVTPTRLSAEPLPDTIGRIAWRLAPPGVHLELTALGAYINAPVYQWEFGDGFVSPQAALEALLPTGYCLDESGFPAVAAVACDERLPADNAALIGEFDEN